MTKFELHCKTWVSGCGSEFCSGAVKKVFYRGSHIPCDILFVGEAPGKVENIRGLPFTGPAGKDPNCGLDRIIKMAVSPKYRVGITNVVSCIPRREGEEKITEPDADQISSCKPRLEEIIALASPKLIFAVGSHARDTLSQGYLHSTRIPKGVSVVHIVHPAWILRQTVAFQGLEVQRVVCAIKDAIHELENPPKKLDLPTTERAAVPKTGSKYRAGKVQSNTPTPNSDIVGNRDATIEGLNDWHDYDKYTLPDDEIPF